MNNEKKCIKVQIFGNVIEVAEYSEWLVFAVVMLFFAASVTIAFLFS